MDLQTEVITTEKTGEGCNGYKMARKWCGSRIVVATCMSTDEIHQLFGSTWQGGTVYRRSDQIPPVEL